MISTLQTEPVLGIGTYKRPLVSWGAIFAGWLAGNAIMLLMMNLGSAIGLQAIDVANADGAKGVAIGAAVWTLISWGVSFFIGGLFAAWLAGHVDRAVGAAHGFCVWALAVVAMVILGAAGIAGTLKAGQTLGAAAAQTAQAADNADLQNEVAERVNSAATALQGNSSEARQEAVQTANKAADYSAGALWVLFLGNLIGLGAAVLGGSVGSNRLNVSYRRF